MSLPLKLRRLWFLNSLYLALCYAHAARADVSPGVTTVGRWAKDGDKLRVTISLAEILTAKQQNILSGGFTTVSQLTIRPMLPNSNQPDPKSIQVLRCTVKFDAWEETYDVARIDARPTVSIEKAFLGYARLCLTAELMEPQVVSQLARTGGQLIAELAVKQTSTQEAEHIKGWLIQQQSGLMQGLFSHMLGELSLNQTIAVRVGVPRMPEHFGREEYPQRQAPLPEESPRKNASR